MELVEGADLAGPAAARDGDRLRAPDRRAAWKRRTKRASSIATSSRRTSRSRPRAVVKMLDFGLAKGGARQAAGKPPTRPPCRSMTEAGMILGTAAYMSPEQARGKAVDKRADIWAFGVVLYEMLTGKMLFGGARPCRTCWPRCSRASPISHALPAGTPPRVRRLLERCLRKDPKLRLRDIGDARILLDEPEPEAPAPHAPARRWAWAAGVATLVAVAAFAGTAGRRTRGGAFPAHSDHQTDRLR